MDSQTKVAIITGSSQGIGKAVAKVLACDGVRPVIIGRERAKVEAVVKEISDAGMPTIGIPTDIRFREEVFRMVDRVLDQYGRIDILVNNAGGSQGAPRSLVEITQEQWDNVIALNLTAPFLCCQAVVPHMIKRRNGVIVNVSSQAGRSASELAGPAYASAKAGVIGLTRQLAKGLGAFNIRVNAVAPGVCLGPGSQAQWDSRSHKDQQEMLAAIPLGRLSTEEEQAEVIAFLCSDRSSYIHGSAIDVNGGRFML
jgi:NAD(P)-dependent dehydrogenase (short-subunit alcohol dehydrogenase family)